MMDKLPEPRSAKTLINPVGDGAGLAFPTKVVL